MIFICIQCGKKFDAVPSKKRRFCSSACFHEFWKLYFQKRFSGKENPFYDKHHTKEAKERISIKKLGRKDSEETKKKKKDYWRDHVQNNRFEKGHIPWCIGKTFKHSEETKEKMRGRIPWNKNSRGLMKANSGSFKKCDERLMGKNNPSWKNGITSLMERIRSSEKYQEWRNEVFKRDNYICQKTNSKGGKLIVHHIQNFSKLIGRIDIKTYKNAMNSTKLWDINNGITLSKSAHSEFHQLFGRIDNNQEQLSQFLHGTRK